jgi:CheY-like chemotaxis protein
MNILVLEDRGSVSIYLRQALEKQGHRVVDAFDANDAQDWWNKRQKFPIHCIILDLNLPPDGLSDEENKDSQGGLLSGWLWISRHVLTDQPNMRSRIIVYSDYLAELRRFVGRERYEDMQHEGIRLISKRGRTSTADQVLDAVRKLAGVGQG